MIGASSVLAQFRAFAEARGLVLPDSIDADGKLHRCDVKGGAKGKSDGAHLLHLDGVPAGGVENHRDGLGWEIWKADIGRKLTPEEEAAHRRTVEAQRAEREAQAKAKRDKARKRAHGLWNAAKPAPDDHPYLVRKGVPSYGLRVGSWPKWTQDRAVRWRETRIPGALLVPMRGTSGTLHSLQAILSERVDGQEKLFLPHGEKAGKFHLIGDPAEGLPLCVAEGVATAASLHQVTGWPVAVAFDAGNLPEVARALREKYPTAPLIVCADDDAFGHCRECEAPVRVADGPMCPACGKEHRCGNAGRTRAREAAQAARGAVAVPEFTDPAGRWQGYQDSGKAPTDFNDVATSSKPGEDPEAVRRILHAAFAAAVDLVSSLPDKAEELRPASPGAPAASTKLKDKGAKPVKRAAQDKGDKAKGVQASAPGGELFELRDGPEGHGVYRLKVEKRGDRSEEVEQFICAPLSITHMVRDPKGENWQRLATFADHDRRTRRVLVPDDMLEGDGLGLARLLRGRGLFIGDSKSGLLKMYVNRCRPEERARLTTRIGWHEDCEQSGRWSFVLGGDHDPIAPDGAELWLHAAQGSGHAQFKTAGTLDDWRAHVAALAAGNSRLTFALSAAFAGGLCWLHPNIAGGFHWAGGSSLGKSALLYAAASTCGAPAYRRTWLLTSTAIEGVAAGHCDAPLLLDELKQAGNPRDVAQAAYMLTSGQGKGRGQAAGGLRETAQFSLLFQSNGEIGLTQFLEENQERAYAGQEVRFCELPADAGAGLGAWDVAHGHADGARFSEALQRAAARYYGSAYPEFIRRTIDARDAMSAEFEALRTNIERHALTEKAGGQAIRAATRFAAVAYAGEKATEWGITGWQQGEAVRACMRLFRDWLRAFGGEENREPRKMVEQVQAWVQAHAGTRLEDWRRPSVSDSHAPRTMNRAGWRRPTVETAALCEKDHVFEYLIYPSAFKAELCAGFDPVQVAKELDRRDLLKRDGRHMTTNAREPGGAGTSRFYVLTAAILSGEQGGD